MHFQPGGGAVKFRTLSRKLCPAAGDLSSHMHRLSLLVLGFASLLPVALRAQAATTPPAAAATPAGAVAKAPAVPAAPMAPVWEARLSSFDDYAYEAKVEAVFEHFYETQAA